MTQSYDSSAMRLARRRQELVAISNAQRMIAAENARAIMRCLSVFDLGMSLFASVRRNPLIGGAVVLGVVLAKPRRIIGWLQTGLSMWKSMQVAMPFITPLMKRFTGAASGAAKPNMPPAAAGDTQPG
jgi:hypothetical protein